MTRHWDQLEGVSLAGEYGLSEWLGGDASGAFFRTPEPALVKVIPEDPATANEQLELWRRTRQLSHPHLLPMLDSGRANAAGEPLLFAVFEYPDDNLATALQNGPLEEKEAHDVLTAALDTLRYIHAQGLVHGAIDPGHIVAVGDTVKLASDTLRDSSGEITHADDVRALGALVYELLTAHPYTPDADLKQISEPYRSIVEHAVEPDPNYRWTLAEILRALDPPKVEKVETPAPAPIPAPAPEPVIVEEAPAPPPPEPRRAPLWIYGAVPMAVIAVVLIFHHGDPEAAPAVVPVAPPPAAAARPATPPPSPLGPRVAAPHGAWRVIAYTYSRLTDAEKKVKRINEKHPALHAAVFTPNGSHRGPYLVALGSRTSKAEAERLQRLAKSKGLPRDTFVRNYSD